MKEYLDKFKYVEEKLEESRRMKPLLDEEKAMRDDKVSHNQELDIVKDFVQYDKMCGIVNEMLENLINVKEFLEKNKEDIFRLAQEQRKSLFEENEDLSELTPEEQARYLEYKNGKLDTLLDEIFESKELTDKFFNEILPKNLEAKFGLSRADYDQLMSETDKTMEKELLLQEILEKIMYKENENMKFNPNIGVTEKLKGGFNFNPEPKK